MFFLYSLTLSIGFLFLLPRFVFDALRKGKYAAGFWQRLGYLPEFRQSEKPVVWLHCVSVGEANAALPLAEKILETFPEYRLVVSTTTKTGQKIARQIYVNRAEMIFYMPFDWRFSVRRALAQIKPNIVLLTETELWFNFVREASKSGARVAIVNGRISEKSFDRYRLIPKTMRRVLHYLDLALVQTDKDARRFVELNIRASKVKVTGNIKFDQKFADAKNDLTDYLRDRFFIAKDAPLIIAASTHASEERFVLDAFKRIYNASNENSPRLLIAPRHPERFSQIEKLIKETGFDWAKRSEEASNRDERAEIILLDSIGELRAAYPLAEIVFVGGSLVPHGGQSILEPAIAGRAAIVTGFYTMNFEAAVKEFLRQNALLQLPQLGDAEIAEKLAEAFLRLLRDAKMREKLAENALAVMRNNRGATDRTVEQLKPFLQNRALRNFAQNNLPKTSFSSDATDNL
ncbi:MAG: 3-deoxy-D-manno-octulosonic acid transferase [Acidobacteria bacterium]|jgi:3-deoxy-D-manno-octulosonic-acid transferase|nr:3-deoxy-D-manno-octulosonic acid transferase [Acidobacteriota bacterium]